MAHKTDVSLDYVKQRGFSVSSGTVNKQRERMLIPEVHVSLCQSCGPRTAGICSHIASCLGRENEDKTFLRNKSTATEGKGKPHSVCIH